MTVDTLPSTPFSLPRITFGMLLGVEEFRSILGHPRGKHLLHQAWLHGPGVVRGFAVTTAEHRITVEPGLALDAMGRELPLRTAQCVDVADWLTDQHRKLKSNSKLRLDVLATAGFELTDPLPHPDGGGALLDPLDPLSAAASRYAETVTIDLVEAPKSPPDDPFRRLRVLLGLARPRPANTGDAEAAGESRRIAKLPPGERPRALLAAFRDFTDRAVAALEPPDAWTDADAFPPGANAGLPLARVVVTPGSGGTPLLGAPDLSVRRSLLPTGLLQELICGLGPGFADRVPDAGGPQVIRSSAGWSGPETFTVEVTSALRPASVNPDSVAVTSVSADGHWVVEQVADATYQDQIITVRMSSPPRHDLIRCRIRGTGDTPVLGVTGAPLAGLDDGPATTGFDGRDAVWQMRGPNP